MATHSSTLVWKSHGWRTLVGCSPWGHKESYTTERLHFHFSLSCTGEGNGKVGCRQWSRTGLDMTEVTQQQQQILTQEPSLFNMQKEMVTHSSTLAERFPWTEEPGGLLSMGSHRVDTTEVTWQALEKEMATHSSIVAWRIPGTEESGGLPSMGSHRVGHD